jgi:hypothetical protein
MDWLTPEGLGTVAGAAFAVTLVTWVLKKVACTTGRGTQTVALVASLVIALATSDVHTAQGALITVLNGCVIFATAMGFDQIATYKKVPE